uniref:Uncharacterized protein n=1 Tax=Anguilla anguilla TaxID=7936 RepID=A0A0E9UTQ0_ANGAN
MPHSCNACR